MALFVLTGSRYFGLFSRIEAHVYEAACAARAARPTNEKNRQSETRARHRRRRVPRLAGLLAVLGFQLAAEATHLYASWRVYSLRQEFSELALACIVVGTLPAVVAVLAKISAQYSRVVLVVWWTLAVRRPRPSRPRTSCRKSELGKLCHY